MNTFVDFNDAFPPNQDDYDGSVDFSDVQFTNTTSLEKEINKEPEYDHATKEKYRVLRNTRMDPITYTVLDEEHAFKFPYKWDPYTGERMGRDETGPLYFDPDILIKHFHTKRLDKLWIQPSDEQNGYFAGHYDDAVGLGDDFYVAGRGSHPEWYLFRLPILDCYLTKDHNKQFITFGPKLTDEEVMEIERLASLRPTNYKQLFRHTRPNLILMKQLYDNAISRTPKLTFMGIDNIKSVPKSERQELYNRENRICVDHLNKMQG